MADTSSVTQAQAIKLCELCDENHTKWKCVVCEMCLCEKCKVHHQKIPATAKHQIVTIATPSQDVKKNPAINNIPCNNHATNMNCLFCKTCDFLVCPECVSTSHTNHQFVPIKKALDDRLDQLNGIKEHVINKLKDCASKDTEIKEHIPNYNSIFDDSVKDIKQKEQDLVAAVSEYSKLLQGKVEVERAKVTTTVRKVEQEIGGARKMLEVLIDRLENALSSSQGQVIFDASLTEPDLIMPSLPSKVEHLIPEGGRKEIQDLFQLFEKLTIPAIHSESGFEDLKTFMTDLPIINQVIPLDETLSWIICENASNTSVIRKVSIYDKNIVTSEDMASNINDMAVTSDDDILMTVHHKSDVMIMTASGQQQSFLKVTPLLPYGIHVTSDNKIIVGVKELGNLFTFFALRTLILLSTRNYHQNKYIIRCNVILIGQDLLFNKHDILLDCDVMPFFLRNLNQILGNDCNNCLLTKNM